MRYDVVVATQHKTGTVWMSSVFSAIAADIGVRYVDFWSEQEAISQGLRSPYVLFNYHSAFREYSHLLESENVRILHLIRDPRDVLISAMPFHMKSDESWLHQPSPDFGGKTYQATLNGLPTKLEKYIFEMENSTMATIGHMTKWNYDRVNSIEVRYEDLIRDVDLNLWTRIVEFLGFDEKELPICRERFWQNSLFGGLAGIPHSHVRSGEVAQWKHEFTPELAKAFLERFPKALQLLGYEKDEAWVDLLAAS